PRVGDDVRQVLRIPFCNLKLQAVVPGIAPWLIAGNVVRESVLLEIVVRDRLQVSQRSCQSSQRGRRRRGQKCRKVVGGGNRRNNIDPILIPQVNALCVDVAGLDRVVSGEQALDAQRAGERVGTLVAERVRRDGRARFLDRGRSRWQGRDQSPVGEKIW